MPVTDPIADFLTRLRNAAKARHKRMDVPCSNEKLAIAKILKEQGYITDFERIDDNKQGILQVSLRYYEGRPAFTEIKRVSKPGIRTYVSVDSLPRVYNGLGVAVISTSKGMMTENQAGQYNVGGEVICTVW